MKSGQTKTLGVIQSQKERFSLHIAKLFNHNVAWD